MTKKKILAWIPIGILGGFLAYTWSLFFTTNIVATWSHYIGLALYMVLLFVFFKNWKKAVVATGIYLILGTCNLLSVTTAVIVQTLGLKIINIEIETPKFQPLSFGLLVLFSILNFDSLCDIYLDHKESKERRHR